MGTKKKLNLVAREEALAKVEALMAKGVSRGSEIAKKVKCSIPTANIYKEAILKRWELEKGNDFVGMKGQQIVKSKELERGCWEAFKTADNSSAKVGALNTLLEVHKYQAWLAGMNKVLNEK